MIMSMSYVMSRVTSCVMSCVTSRVMPPVRVWRHVGGVGVAAEAAVGDGEVGAVVQVEAPPVPPLQPTHYRDVPDVHFTFCIYINA